MSSFVLSGGRVYGFDPHAARWACGDALVVRDGHVVSLRITDADAGTPHIPLDGRAVYPAFADCHVHLTDTGLFLGPADLSGVRDAAGFERAVAALPYAGVVLAGNYDDSAWPHGERASAAPLEREHAGSIAMAVRVDGHSSVVNRRALELAALAPETPGIERDEHGVPTGTLFLEANWRAQARVLAAVPPKQRRAAERRATELALREGALHLHVQLVGLGDREAYAAEIAALRDAGPAKWHPKICEPDAALARSFGLPYVGGDVFLDGSIGSGTAALTAPYHDRPGCGTLMHGDDEVVAYFAEAEALGVSAGVHAIGDAAIEQCLRAWETVLGGQPSPRNRHFIEHFEIATPAQIARAARLGLFLSMQPQFDALWGAPGGMYDARLGAERARGMNALRSARSAGAVVVGGDDSPVCRLSPLEGMRAAMQHHNLAERLTVEDALQMYTYDAARFGHAERETGTLLPGYAADFVVLDGDPIAARSFDGVRVGETWSDGVRVA
ncbi:MAG TPA: amidohydrolase family protein [Candidatus Baltobacteraceae bacterium]|nr:amidohydrolase family protein [Candidatus Baltobacteraceae bacterium]